MLRLRTKVTRKGQVTVPVEIRRALGLKEGDPVEFILDDGVARIEAAQSVVERTRGIFKSNLPPLTERQLKDAAEQAWADDAYDRMNR
jgi:AbrB family looped-hinge helix DNA binding protein